jgi:hypothetical protein
VSRLFVDASGNVGVGAAPTKRFDVGGGLFAVDSAGFVDNKITYTAAGGVADRQYEIFGTVSSPESVGSYYPRALFCQVETAGAPNFGGASEIIGLQGQVADTANININAVNGLLGRLIKRSTGTITTGIGLAGAIRVDTNSSAITNAFPVDGNLVVQSGRTLTSTALALFNGRTTISGSIGGVTNYYGLCLPNIVGATNNWAIFTGGGAVEFNSNLATTDILTLDGAAYQSGSYLRARDNSNNVGFEIKADFDVVGSGNINCDGYLAIKDGISAPGAATGKARIYVDSTDGDLKVVFADGTVKTIVADT